MPSNDVASVLLVVLVNVFLVANHYRFWPFPPRLDEPKFRDKTRMVREV